MSHLRTLAAVLLLAQGPTIAWASQADPASQATVRNVMPLSEGWRFHFGDAAGAEAPGFTDDSWTEVSVPHTWNRVGYYLPDPQSHVHRAETVNKAQGIGWYRLTFTPSADTRGKRAWLQFDAASRIAKVWLNGKLLGEHRGGFSRFRLDATDALRPRASNLLVVRTDNTKPAPGASTADVLPLTGDFFIHGGLYRPVSLLTTDPVHIDMLDFGGPGAYATTRSMDGRRATIDVRTKVRNDSRAAARLSVTTRLLDADGRIAAEASAPLALRAGAGEETAQTMELRDAHLWQGTRDPYLYRLVVEVRSVGGAVLDRVEQPFGVRQMGFDAAQGFILNGTPYRLHGVGLHQDREGKGWALAPDDIESDIATLREMGANTIRLTHYQHGQAIHDLADRYGLVLWDEIPLVSAWTLGAAEVPSPGLRANAAQQLRELIRQNFNHPSVANWGIANEVDFGNSLPAFLTGRTGAPPDPMPFLRELNALAHSEDPSRPTALATCCEGRLFGPGIDVPVTAGAADLGGANRYFGWYFGRTEDLDAHLDALHAKRPQQPLSVTEYGAGGATTMHTDNVVGAPIDSRGRAQPEEYKSFVHERNWQQPSRPYLWGTWLWNTFDFATTAREGDANDINTKGLVTYDRRIRKDPFFFYKANWTTPTVHINGRRYVDRAYRFTDVRVYSNAPSTESDPQRDVAGRKGGLSRQICVCSPRSG